MSATALACSGDDDDDNSSTLFQPNGPAPSPSAESAGGIDWPCTEDYHCAEENYCFQNAVYVGAYLCTRHCTPTTSNGFTSYSCPGEGPEVYCERLGETTLGTYCRVRCGVAKEDGGVTTCPPGSSCRDGRCQRPCAASRSCE